MRLDFGFRSGDLLAAAAAMLLGLTSCGRIPALPEGPVMATQQDPGETMSAAASDAAPQAAGDAGPASGGAQAAGEDPETGGMAQNGGDDPEPATGGSAAAGSGGAKDEGGDDGNGEGGAPAEPPPPEVLDGLWGWAAVAGDGVETTRGGADGETVRPDSDDALQAYVAQPGPLVIELEGEFDVPLLAVSSNKTLVGVGAGATLRGGVQIRGFDIATPVSNVVLQNLTIDASNSAVEGDGVQIHYAHHIWVDHCAIYDATDGNLEVVHAGNWVTVSWTHFFFTQDAEGYETRNSNLIGHDDANGDEDRDRLKVTFHHNWWGPSIDERMPRVRFGQVHLYNNYYSSAGNNYAIAAAVYSNLRIEANYFEDIKDPHLFYFDTATAQILSIDNVYSNSTGLQDEGQGQGFMPPYGFELDEAESVPMLVMNGAGPQN